MRGFVRTQTQKIVGRIMIERNLYIDLLSGLFMSNTENPTRPSISGEPAGRVFIQTGETNMNNKTAYKINTYKRYYGKWSEMENIQFLTVSEFQDSEIYENTQKVNEFAKEHGNLTPDFLATLTRSGNDPHFPEVRTNGGPKIFTEDEYIEAKAVVNNYETKMKSVIDVDGFLTTNEAEFDRAMIYESTEKAKNVMVAYQEQLETEKLLDKMMPNWRNK